MAGVALWTATLQRLHGMNRYHYTTGQHFNLCHKPIEIFRGKSCLFVSVQSFWFGQPHRKSQKIEGLKRQKQQNQTQCSTFFGNVILVRDIQKLTETVQPFAYMSGDETLREIRTAFKIRVQIGTESEYTIISYKPRDLLKLIEHQEELTGDRNTT